MIVVCLGGIGVVVAGCYSNDSGSDAGGFRSSRSQVSDSAQETQSRERIKLSDAMRSAASNGAAPVTGPRVESTRSTGPGVSLPWDGEGESNYGQASSTVGAFPESKDDIAYLNKDYWAVPIDVAYTRPFAGEIRSLWEFNVTPLVYETTRHFLGWYVGGGFVEFESGGLADSAAKGPWTLETGLNYRWYFNHERTGISPYVTARAGGQWLFWRYRNDVITSTGQFSSDILPSLEGFVGLGLTTIRDSHFGVFVEGGVGGNGFLGTTAKGFENDVFDNYGFFSAKAGITIKF